MTVLTWYPSPNFSAANRQRGDVLGIVVHSTEGLLAGALATLTRPGGASAHYVVDRDGRVYQLVEERHVAYHVAAFGDQPALNRNRPSWLPPYAGQFSAVNAATVGIELVGFAAAGFTTEQYQSLGALCAGICARWDIPARLLPDADIYATLTTHAFLQTDRYDPGRHFDWEALQGFMDMDEAERRGLLERIAALEADQARCNAIKAEYESWLAAREGRRVTVPLGLVRRLIAAAGN